jgi:hypothetical protein
MANKYDRLAGKKVIFTGKTDFDQTNIFEIGKEYEVVRHGVCARGEGVMVGGDKYGLVIVEGNFKEEPTPLTLKEFLAAIYNGEEVVTVDEDGDIVDRYDSFEQLEDNLAFFEIEDCKFYIAEEYETDEIELGDPRGTEVTFAEAVKALADGKKVASYDEHGDNIDTYHSISDITDIAKFEIDECKWFIRN